MPVALGGALLVALACPTDARAARARHDDVAPRLHDADGRLVAPKRDVRWQSPSDRRGAIAALRKDVGRAWIAWDHTTGTPHRVLLEGLAAPGVMTSDAAAAELSREVLARHLAMLAPGATIDDFVLVANDHSGGIRSVGFQQHHRGKPVYGGQISFRFKHDRLVAIANDALPNVAVATGARTRTATAKARTWLERDAAADDIHVGAEDVDTLIMPVQTPTGLTYREVVRVPVDVDAPVGRWSVYVDATSGEPVARRQELLFADAGVVYRVPLRSPLDARGDFGVPFVDVFVDGIGVTTNELGVFQYFSSPGAAVNSPRGPFVGVTDNGGPPASNEFLAVPGSGTVWDAVGDETVDAQLASFVHASIVKAYVRGVAPDLAWLDNQIQVTVNIDDTCNAFSDGDSINFYRASEFCENTGLLADVVYHEFGHSVHAQSLILGVGFFDVALSEGISDYLSMTITGDPGLARGFYYDETPLRDLDPQGFEYTWPEDAGEVHDEGRIIGGALWDLRKLLVAKYGTPGVFATDRIWYEATRRAVDIPSMYLEALVVDDDDGNLGNGTPNVCEINAAFGAHGLFTPGNDAVSLTETPATDGIRVDLQVALPSFPNCPVGASPTLTWRLRDQPGETVVAMTASGGGWTATIPPQVGPVVVEYRVDVNYDSGTAGHMPDNFVDPWYQTFVGATIPLYCTSFTDGAAGWSLVGDWSAGPPSGTSGNRDPAVSWDGDGIVFGNALSLEGLYQAGTNAVATLPTVSTTGYSNIHLQYRRWLTVEDGFFDRASISADGVQKWRQYASEIDQAASQHHVDREWRFHDVDISAEAADGAVSVAFELSSDGGLELGGWTIDSLCVVAVDASASAGCGNGALEVGEGCDDGNVAPDDGCDAACQPEPIDPGDGPSDDDSTGGDDDGSSTGDEPGLDAGGLLGRGCGCTTSDAPTRSAWPAGLLGVAMLLRRRRR
jgi:MYXO-CTERM domain-containing protein